MVESGSKYDQIDLHSVPGKYRDLSKGFVGIETSEFIRNFNFDYCLIGAEGISVASGVTLIDKDDAFTKRAVMNQSKCKVLVSDSSKFGKNFLYKIGEVSDFDYIITDHHLDKHIYKEINQITKLVTVTEDN